MGTASIPPCAQSPKGHPKGSRIGSCRWSRCCKKPSRQVAGHSTLFPGKLGPASLRDLRIRVMSGISIIQSASDLPASPPRLIVLGASKAQSREA